MKKARLSMVVVCLLVICISLPLSGATTISVDREHPGAKIAPTMWGLFIEDINFIGDGGLYAELVKNRSFEFPDAMMGWSKVNEDPKAGSIVVIQKEKYEEANARCLRMEVKKDRAEVGICNEGYRGIGIKQDQSYYFTTWSRTSEPEMRVRVEVVAENGQTLLSGKFTAEAGNWQHHCFQMKARATGMKGRLIVTAISKGTIDLDSISLFPENTARQMYGRMVPGLRADLVAMMAAMKPGFLRFPGGCIVEGFNLATRYQWKKTVGDLDDRQVLINRWNIEFKHRLTPDYFQSFGLGFFEYFELAEQIGAEPMPIINCGMACQFNTGQTVAVEKLGPYVQDALDLIEFANGPADSRWGRLRATMGHPAPFNMKYLGVGNEQWGPQYVERYQIFAKALKEKYPDVQLIAATGSDPAIFPNGPAEVDYLWSQWRVLKPDIVDEHFYRPADWFYHNAHYYDKYDRQGPKLFVGEYAAMSHFVGSPDNRNNLKCALAEASFMTGMERNAAVVVMSSYAPMAGHVDGWQWKPNLFWYDNLTAYATPNYYVQQMFSLNRGDCELPIKVTGADGMLLPASACLEESTGQTIVKVVNPGADPVEVALVIDGIKQPGAGSQALVLAGHPDDENSIREPKKIAPVQEAWNGADLHYTLKPYSLTVLRVAE